MRKILVLNGPNLNLLGEREPAVYGSSTLDDLERSCQEWGHKRGIEIVCKQSNHEGKLVDIIQSARLDCDGIVLNGAAYSHTSIALRDCISAVSIPVIEVHISNTAKREDFRHHSYLTGVAKGLIMGFGLKGYILALDALTDI